MRADKCHFVAIAKGDVAGVAVIHFTTDARLVIHDRDSEAPLIQVLLSERERFALIEALRDCPRCSSRRPFRALRLPRRLHPEEV